MIVTALAAGAVKGAGETASAAVSDAYQGLKRLLGRMFGTNSRAELVLTEHETDPDTWQAPLAKLLAEVGADRDTQVVAAAERLLELADPQGSSAGKYVIDARGATVANIGDHARQTNTFGAPSAT